MAGCGRRTWDGNRGDCCRTCRKSGGTSHGDECEKRARTPPRELPSGSDRQERPSQSEQNTAQRRNLIPEIALGDLQMEDVPLAEGSFKEVFRAKLTVAVPDVGAAGQSVAVIRLRPGPGSLVPELDVFTRLGRHPNLTRLLAVTRSENQIASLVTEFAELGSLDHVVGTRVALSLSPCRLCARSY